MTLVGTPRLSEEDVARATEICRGEETRWLESGRAADISCRRSPSIHALEEAIPHADVFVQPEDERARRLFVADMDSTMIMVECIDELADFAGRRKEVAAVTEAAMRGELDFETALRDRVAKLKGLPARMVAECLGERVALSPGATRLISTLSARGVRTCLVSGGFHSFADPIASRLGFDVAKANRLAVAGGKLTGEVVGDIVGAQQKLDLLREQAEAMGLQPHETIAVGDGANDLLMIEAAGLGVSYHGKPKLAEAADARIRSGDLTSILHAMGIPPAEWVR